MNAELLHDLAALSNDPYRLVLWAFPWGEAGTDLAGQAGPEPWQMEVLQQIRDGLLTPNEAVQLAVASGHGIGKSALVSWIILWAISTFEDTRGVVTANTENQLKTKTWVELAKWFRLFIARDLFELTATKLCSRDPEHAETWRIDMVPWSERNTEAFAGLHNQGRRILVLFDEASAIPDVIHETTEGALTDLDTQIIWGMFGNPTRNAGRFREAFRSGRWWTKQVDSREVSFTNKAQIAKWVEDYGEDSDFVRIRVRGVFPRVGALEFISLAVVDEARRREAIAHQYDPLVLGVDVARFGDDESVIFIRRGRDGRTHEPIRLRNVDTMTLAGRVAELAQAMTPDAIFVDEGGVGGGVVDRLRQLRVHCIGVNFGSKPDRAEPAIAGEAYANKRAEMWGMMREWLKGGAIPDIEELAGQLVGPTYGFNANNAIQLERKEDMKKRGVSSPDLADALALTFAYPVLPDTTRSRTGKAENFVFEYNPYSEERMAM